MNWINQLKADETHNYASYTKLYSSHKIVRAKPGTVDDNVHWKFRIEYEHESPEAFVAVIPKGRVWGSSGAIITPDDQLLVDLSPEHIDSIEDHSIFGQFKLPPVQYIQGKVAVLSVVGSQGYFHWMFDVLPRINLLLRSQVDWNSIDKFILSSCHLPFQKETLAKVGIPKDRIIESRNYPHVKADQLLVPSLAGKTGNMPDWACNFIRDKFLVDNNDKKSELPRRIYISRAQANTRRLLNEDELMNFLNQLGFRRVFLESLSVAEQALLFANAEVIVAPHGAGLTNLVFCKSGTKVIEIFSPQYVNVCYWSLSNQVGLDYYYLLGQGNHPPEYVDPHVGNVDICVDINGLSDLFQLAGVK